ncbi:MAG TPA: hypothetical protein VKM35_11045, partial [Arenimonas sp.]|nr:hypothetical protein [Arenimonas sp.]
MKIVAAFALALFALNVAAQVAEPVGPSKVLAISEVQGTGLQSPMIGQRVMVEGVAVYAGSPADQQAGMYLQSVKWGSDRHASNAIYVVLSPATSRIKRDVLVRVTGTVAELGTAPNTMTALVDAHLQILGAAKRPSTSFPGAQIDEFGLERYEGVSLIYSVTVTGADHLRDRGELDVSLDGRLFSPTEVATPGKAANSVAEKNARRLVVVDDSLDLQAPASQWYLQWPVSQKTPLRVGESLSFWGVL